MIYVWIWGFSFVIKNVKVTFPEWQSFEATMQASSVAVALLCTTGLEKKQNTCGNGR